MHTLYFLKETEEKNKKNTKRELDFKTRLVAEGDQ